jgi:hypothetical protein
MLLIKQNTLTETSKMEQYEIDRIKRDAERMAEAMTKVKIEMAGRVFEAIMSERTETGEAEYNYRVMARDVLDRASLPQVWSLFKRAIIQQAPFEILRCNPADHLAITFAEMYVGVEPDGYMHS